MDGSDGFKLPGGLKPDAPQMAQPMTRAGSARMNIDHKGKPGRVHMQHDTLARTDYVRSRAADKVNLKAKIRESEQRLLSEAAVLTQLTQRFKVDTYADEDDEDDEDTVAAEADEE